METDIQAEQLVRENIEWMMGLAERMLQDRGLAEDAVQEAFINAFRGLENFESRSSLKTWLHRITVNAALTKLRQLNRFAEKPMDDNLPEFDQYDSRIESNWTFMASTQEIVESETLRALVHEKMGE